MPSRYNLPHINIAAFLATHDYVGEGMPGNPAVRERQAHGQRLRNELRASLDMAMQTRPIDERLPPPTGSVIEVELRRGTEGDKLDMIRQGVRSGAVKPTPANDRTIALFVPDHARAALEKIINDYLERDTDRGNPRNQGKVEAIEAFRRARLDTFWTDDPDALPTDPQAQIWWGLWCHPDSEAAIELVCERLDVRVASRDRRLYFPEVTVLPALTTRATIELMLFATGAIAELRRASDNPVFFTEDVAGDQHLWTDDLAERITWPGTNVPAVCIFDTGVNRGHALLEPALAQDDLHTLDQRWGVDDQHPSGHGTSMAGLALHGDLTASLGDASRRTLSHRLESVKLLPPTPFDPNDPKSYGVLTQAGVALPEIKAPERPRIFCMAVTNDDVSGSRPSSWSGAIDQAAVGRMVGDDFEEEATEDDVDADEADRPKRLFILSAGNVTPETDFRRLRAQDDFPIEDPAQAWNAITIGGYTDLVDVRDAGYESWTLAS